MTTPSRGVVGRILPSNAGVLQHMQYLACMRQKDTLPGHVRRRLLVAILATSSEAPTLDYLRARLALRGVTVDASTVSRDLKALVAEACGGLRVSPMSGR